MAVRTREQSAAPGPRPPARGLGPSGVGRQRPGKGTAFWWWLFMRVSGLVLLFLAVGHVLIIHVFGGGVDQVDFEFVAVRWNSPFWKTWDWTMLILALVHGINGLRVITLDYVRRPGIRAAITGFFTIAGVIAFTLGTVVVFTFDACKWPTYTGPGC
jgi:succinate dehydrogenase / fumarate reductase, membrane anchor subunit